jgi:syntaxin 7
MSYDQTFIRQEVLLLENEVVFHEALIEEREQGIREIQQQIGDVNEMFKDLAVLVHEQGVIIGRNPYPAILYRYRHDILSILQSCCWLFFAFS